MRTSVALPDELGERVRQLAADEGISQSEWLRRTIERACSPGPTTGQATLETEPSQTSTAALSALEERATIAEANHAGALAEIAVLKAEAAKDAEHIASLQKTIATVAAGGRSLPAPGQAGIFTRIKVWALGTPPAPAQ